jgi:hypothetical protein
MRTSFLPAFEGRVPFYGVTGGRVAARFLLIKRRVIASCGLKIA